MNYFSKRNSKRHFELRKITFNVKVNISNYTVVLYLYIPINIYCLILSLNYSNIYYLYIQVMIDIPGETHHEMDIALSTITTARQAIHTLLRQLGKPCDPNHITRYRLMVNNARLGGDYCIYLCLLMCTSYIS